MRVISLVPSWTETLIECGLDIVGRTGFCLHPANKVKDIPVVGGTKKVDWQKISELKPNIIIFDKEENTKKMAEACEHPYLATHIESLEDVSRELEMLSQKLNNSQLLELSHRWKDVDKKEVSLTDIHKLPGVVEWITPPSEEIKNIVYIIWKDPWMTITEPTFIGSVLRKVGLQQQILPLNPDKKYPEINLEELCNKNTLLLFSTEPYPFAKKVDELKTLSVPSAIVDGESYSWFGIRSLKFLEEAAL